MKKFAKAIAAALAALMIVASLSACSLLESKKTFTISTNAQFEPFEFIGDDGEYTGFDIEMAQYIADYMGCELKVEDMEFNSVITAVTSGKSDAAIACITITDERKQTVDFCDSYYSTAQSIIVNEGSEIKGVDDLAGKKIGVLLGTTGDLFVCDYVEDCEVAQFFSGNEAALDLVNGKIDAIVIDAQPAVALAAKNDGLVVLDEPLTDEQIGIAVNKGNTELLDQINAAIAKMQSDGTYDELLVKYGLAANAD